MLPHHAKSPSNNVTAFGSGDSDPKSSAENLLPSPTTQEQHGQSTLGGFIPTLRGYKRVGGIYPHKDEDDDDVGYGAPAGRTEQTRRSLFNRTTVTAANALLFLVSLLVWGHAYGLTRRSAKYHCGKEMLAPLEFPQELLLFNAPTSFPGIDPSYTNGTPTPASNILWQSLRPPGDGAIELPNALTHPSNLPPTLWPSIHHPDTHSVYGLSVFHQLHCLDMLRKSFYLPAGPAKAFAADFTEHRDHCIEYLRQAIMCSADVTFEPRTVAGGSINGTGATHMCRDWERIYRWADERHYVEENEWDDETMPGVGRE